MNQTELDPPRSECVLETALKTLGNVSLVKTCRFILLNTLAGLCGPASCLGCRLPAEFCGAEQSSSPLVLRSSRYSRTSAGGSWCSYMIGGDAYSSPPLCPLLFVIPSVSVLKETCWEPSPILRGANIRDTILEGLDPAAWWAGPKMRAGLSGLFNTTDVPVPLPSPDPILGCVLLRILFFCNYYCYWNNERIYVTLLGHTYFITYWEQEVTSFEYPR